MAEKTLLARVREDEENPGLLLVTSPVVGLADGGPRTEVFLNSLDRVVSIKILGERYSLRLPRGHHGRVIEVCIPDELTPVDFDQPLVRLDPRAFDAEVSGGGSAAAVAGGGGEETGLGLATITAPSEGIFYRRSSPDSPAYVEVGTEVSSGTVLGLVEVMKCFNQITYGGDEYPEKGKIVKILVDDSAEVTFGQALFQVVQLDG